MYPQRRHPSVCSAFAASKRSVALTLFPLTFRTTENPELKDAKATHASLSTRHTAAQDTVRSLTRRLHDTDYGPGGIWAGLVGTCIKWDGDPQYTFELCLLDKIMQRPKDGSMAITLG